MGSRLKQNPQQTFYWFFEASRPISRDQDPGLQFTFPEDFNDEESRTDLPRFCFPYDIQRVRDGAPVQHFTFVLTDSEGCQRFGFCRLTNSTHTCLCMLSHLPWFEVFYKLLNNLADYLVKGQTREAKELLSALYNQPVPLTVGSVALQMVPFFVAPDPRSLPSIPENRNLTELIVAVDVGNLLQLYASMLFERRILIFASKLSTLTACIHALSAVLYPMYWQHIFIPVLPPHLLDYCCAPMPYLIGVHTSLSDTVRGRGLEDVVTLNVDTNMLETPFDDMRRIPANVVSGLKACLRRQAVSPGCGVSRAFLKAQALLFGGYRDALQGNEEGEMCFNEELFLNHKSPSMRHFLQSAVHLQFFTQFIDGRLEVLREGKEPDDLLEEEILRSGTAGRSRSYQHFVGNLKKGGALIHNMKSKANVKAKGFTKTGLKSLLMHKAHSEDHALKKCQSVSHRRAQSDCLQNRLPITPHFGTSRPRRPLQKLGDPSEEEDLIAAMLDGAESDVCLRDEDEEEEREHGEDSPLCDGEEMDLLGEIFDTLSCRNPDERGLLYSARSLDLFGPDNYDYVTKRGPIAPSQESLSPSASGSGSLHSWNLETTEEESDQSEWPYVDIGGSREERSHSEPKPEEQESGAGVLTEEEGNTSLVARGSDGGGINDHRSNSEEDGRGEGEEGGEEEVSVGGGDSFKERVESGANEGLAGMEEGEGCSEEEEVERGMDDVQEVAVGDEGKKHDDVFSSQTERQKEEERQDPTEPSSTPSAGTSQQLDHRSTNEVATEELPTRGQAPCPTPTVLAAAARFQSLSSGKSFQMKSWTRSPEESGRPFSVSSLRGGTPTETPCDPQHPTHVNEKTSEDGDPTPVKVSELKKRFEA